MQSNTIFNENYINSVYKLVVSYDKENYDIKKELHKTKFDNELYKKDMDKAKGIIKNLKIEIDTIKKPLNKKISSISKLCSAFGRELSEDEKIQIETECKKAHADLFNDI